MPIRGRPELAHLEVRHRSAIGYLPRARFGIQRDADLDLGVDTLFDTREHAGQRISIRAGSALYSAEAVTDAWRG
jgi:hypothetical protein